MVFSTLLFDLDETLYRSSTGLWDAIRVRMDRFIYERLGLPEQVIPQLREQYYRQYGTTLRGLQIHHDVDSDDYLAYVHDLPLKDYLQPDPTLQALLGHLPQPCWIFTNADSAHAYRVLDILGVRDCFVGVIDVRDVHPACKPAPEAMQRALEIAGNPRPGECVFLDDSPANIAGARQFGLTTVLVGNGAHSHAATYCVANLTDLPAAHPEFWRDLVGDV
ncbi:MAG TPA: pyrimidine 5'-nucleotidase [Anaerolineales bacterium]|nr:pyrimidine 5'-nucleotidase [Anaerolineales bacterium]